MMRFIKGMRQTAAIIKWSNSYFKILCSDQSSVRSFRSAMCKYGEYQCYNSMESNWSCWWTCNSIQYSWWSNRHFGRFYGNTKITTLTLTATWFWEYLWSNGNLNNGEISNQNPRMRFDEVRYKLPSKIASSGI